MPKRSPEGTRLRLKPADSFDLIRLLARSQHDPRKAVCELVQNSLDAQARWVHIIWFKDKGRHAVRIRDDGEGIFPELDRRDALRRIATTIGHSHKRALTPAQRREQMALGKYGIGLLGFWAVGEQMQIVSRVGGGDTWRLVLHEDSPEARVERSRARRMDDLSTFTEVTIHGIHEQVLRQIRPPRLQAYLSGELRGQLMGRDVEIHIRDRIARGRAVKDFHVKAERFLGRFLTDLSRLEVKGHEDARLELYLVAADDDRRGHVSLACGGTVVLDDICLVDGIGEPRAPWDSGRFEGVVDFPDLEVSPGTRREFRRNEAATAFLDALTSLEEQLAVVLEEDERRKREELDRNLAKRIKRAFRRIPRLLPEYDLFDVRDGAAGAGSAPRGEDVREPVVSGANGLEAEVALQEGDGLLYEPGPLASVAITPGRSRLPTVGTRKLWSKALDQDGRPASGSVAFTWTLTGPGVLSQGGGSACYVAPQLPGRATVHVVARQGAIECSASAEIEVTDEPVGGADVGIPDPIPVQAEGENWRSRFVGGGWEYNTAHRDYLAACGSEPRRLRYLVHLFAKEVVLHNFGRPGDQGVLERMVEVLTHLEESGPKPR